MALNKAIMMGRITKDIELRRTGSGVAVASFSIAVDRDFGKNEAGEKETDFFDVVAWRQTAEFVAKHFGKGRMIVIVGSLQTRSWTDNNGNKRKTVEIVADNVYFGDSKKQDDGYTGFVPSKDVPQASNFAMLDDDDAQLPF